MIVFCLWDQSEQEWLILVIGRSRILCYLPLVSKYQKTGIQFHLSLQITIDQEQSVLIIINNIIYTSLMLLFSLLFIVHLEVILNLWMKNYLCTVFWRFVSKEEEMEPHLRYQNFKRVIWGQYGSVYYDNFVVVSCIWIQNYKRELRCTCAITNHPLNSILGGPGAASWDRILTATGKVYDKNKRAS